MWFDIIGSLSSISFVLCLGGLLDQIKRITRDWHLPDASATGALSLNQFVSSFLSFYGFFVYSFILENINIFLLLTRFGACALTATVIFLIAANRKSAISIVIASVVSLSFVLAAAIYINRHLWIDSAKFGIQIFIVIATLLLLQGGIHRVSIIRTNHTVGSLSFKMTAMFFIKDILNVLFGVAMGFIDGWPLILMGTVSGSTKGSILLQFLKFGRPYAKVQPSKTAG